MYQKGDLVFTYGSRGLILDIFETVKSTDYLILFFPQPHQFGASWISEKWLRKVC